VNPTEAASLPKVRLSRAQLARMVVVGLLVVLALGRPLADFVRIVYPLSYFGYTTDGDAVVTYAPAIAPGSVTRKPQPPRRGARPVSTAPVASTASTRSSANPDSPPAARTPTTTSIAGCRSSAAGASA